MTTEAADGADAHEVTGSSQEPQLRYSQPASHEVSLGWVDW